jgi:hypothetical protein
MAFFVHEVHWNQSFLFLGFPSENILSQQKKPPQRTAANTQADQPISPSAHQREQREQRERAMDGSP